MTDSYLRPGSSRCECAACGRRFSSVSGFDRHQEMIGNRYTPTLVCHDPSTRGLVEIDGVWQYPPITGMAKEAYTSRLGRTKGADPMVDDLEADFGPLWAVHSATGEHRS